MQIKVGPFADGFVWWVVKDGRVMEQGQADTPKEARKEAESAALLWATHEYESD